MKWTFRLMTAACVMFTSAQVLVSQDWAVELGIDTGWSGDAVAMDMATPSADEATLQLLNAPAEVERMLRTVEPMPLSRNPFNSSALIPLAPIGSSGDAWYAMDLSGPARWQSGSRASVDARSAGRMSRASRASASGVTRETAIDARSRVNRRLDRSVSLFEQTRFGALHKNQLAQFRRSIRRSGQGSVSRSSRR